MYYVLKLAALVLARIIMLLLLVIEILNATKLIEKIGALLKPCA